MDIQCLQKTIQEEGLDGWFFVNFQHRDHLSDEILGISIEHKNTRSWVYAIPRTGEPVKIVHTIEANILSNLPGISVLYTGQEAFQAALKRFAHQTWAVHSDPCLPVISYLDAGTATLLTKSGITLTSAAGLIQRTKGLLDEAGIASHERATRALYEIVANTWQFIQSAYQNKMPLYEGDIRSYIMECMAQKALITDHPPIVAAGNNSGNPHYDFEGRGTLLQEGLVLQLDIWAKENIASSIYADISWVGIFGTIVPAYVQQVFKDLIEGREYVISYIQEMFANNQRPDGASVDRAVRSFFIQRGYEKALQHRTGHGIDTQCHGSGVNIDSIEFPDTRLLLDGSCFSIEPGLYFPEFGLRTEVNMYITQKKAMVSGKDRQFHCITMAG